MVLPLYNTALQLLKKLKLGVSYGPATPLLVIYSKALKAGIQRDICTPKFIDALFTIAKGWK